MKNSLKLLVIALILGALLWSEFGSQAIGDPIAPNTQVNVKIYDTSGGISTKTWGQVNYGYCAANMPGYAYAPANALVDTCGNVIQNVQSRICPGNAYKYPNDVYFMPGLTGNGQFTGDKPRQHPDCAAEILAYAQSAGVNVTNVVFVDRENTVIKEIVTNQTVYVCSETGQFISDPSQCTAAEVVPVTETSRGVWLYFALGAVIVGGLWWLKK